MMKQCLRFVCSSVQLGCLWLIMWNLNVCVCYVVTQGVEEPQGDLKDEGPVEYISYWKPNITINLVDDFTKYVAS